MQLCSSAVARCAAVVVTLHPLPPRCGELRPRLPGPAVPAGAPHRGHQRPALRPPQHRSLLASGERGGAAPDHQHLREQGVRSLGCVCREDGESECAGLQKAERLTGCAGAVNISYEVTAGALRDLSPLEGALAEPGLDFIAGAGSVILQDGQTSVAIPVTIMEVKAEQA